MFPKLIAFAKDDSGAVTADWVVMTGAIVGIGLVMMNEIRPAAADISTSARSAYATPKVTVEYPVVDPDPDPQDDIEVVLF